MNRLLLLIGPVLSLLGSLGFFMYGNALVNVFDVLTFHSGDEALSSAMADFHWAVVSVSALVIGLIMLCAAFVIRDSGQSITKVGRMMYVGAGLLLLIGTLFLIWSNMSARSSFAEIATAPTTPTVDRLQEMIQSVEPLMAVGSVLLGLSTLIMLVAGLVGFQKDSTTDHAKRGTLGGAFAMVSVLVGGILLLLVIFIRENGIALETLLTPPSIPQPSELGSRLTGILNKSLLIFLGLAMMGLLQGFHVLFVPSARSDIDSDTLT